MLAISSKSERLATLGGGGEDSRGSDSMHFEHSRSVRTGFRLQRSQRVFMRLRGYAMDEVFAKYLSCLLIAGV
jgi:hypothetical protein